VNKLSFVQKLWLPLVISLIALLLVAVFGAYQGRQIRIEERKNDLVHVANIGMSIVKEYASLEQKGELSRRYVIAVENLKAAQKHLAQAAPDLLATLRRHHETFRAMLQINLTVLATAHAVSEGIVRGVNAEVQRRNIPNTYTAAGKRAAPSPRQIRPLAVSRSL